MHYYNSLAMNEKFGDHKANSSKAFLLTLAFLVCLFLFCLLAYKTVYKKELAFDNAVLLFVTKNSSAAVIELMRIITFFGSRLFLFPAYCLLIVFLLTRGKKQRSIEIATIAIVSSLMLSAFKIIFHRQRPVISLIPDISTFSFPSAHAFSSLIYCGIISYLLWEGKLSIFWKRISTVLLMMLSLAVGISRVILQVHYATDIIAGFCLGIICLILIDRYIFCSKSKKV